MSTKGEVLLGSLFLCSTTTGCLTATRFFVNNLSCAASLGHSCIGRGRFWKGLAINKWCRLGCITFDKQKECSFLSFQSELCAWRCISWICWVMHSLHLYIFEWNFWVKVAETISFYLLFADWAPLVINRSPCNSNLSSLFNLTGAPYHQIRGAAYFCWLVPT